MIFKCLFPCNITLFISKNSKEHTQKPFGEEWRRMLEKKPSCGSEFRLVLSICVQPSLLTSARAWVSSLIEMLRQIRKLLRGEV